MIEKYRHYILSIVLLPFMLISCKPNDVNMGSLFLSKNDAIGVQADGEEIKLIVTSIGDWEAVSSDTWLEPNISIGTGRTRVTIKVKPNLRGEERTGSIEFKSDDDAVSFKVTQVGGEVNLDNYIYEIPIIFHVLYNETERKEKKLVVINSERLQGLLNYVNERYAGVTLVPNPETGKREAEKANIRFVLATHDSQGKLLSPSGINNVTIKEKSLDPIAVMNSKPGETYHDISWPLHSYINVFIFPFTHETSDNTVVLGIAHFPNVDERHPLDGLTGNSFKIDKYSNYNHSVVINAVQFEPSFYESSLKIHKQNTAATTLAHELGHYLGLYHTFAEEMKKEENKESIEMLKEGCVDSDHCVDTKSYNRVQYQNQMLELFATGAKVRHEELVVGLLRRVGCDRQVFDSYNLMDYEISQSDRFTAQQIARMRHVLYYSHIVPGEKLVEPKPSTRTIHYAVPRVATCAVGQHAYIGHLSCGQY